VIASGHWLLGAFDQFEEQFTRTLAVSSPIEIMSLQLYRSMMLLDQRKLDEASALADWLFNELRSRGARLLSTGARLCWVEAQLYQGNTQVAEAAALDMSAVEDEPYSGMLYPTVLARIRLAQGRLPDALELAERAYARSQACGMGYNIRHAMLLLVRAEAFYALGNHDNAREAIREARSDLLRQAALIPDSEPEVRRCFLENLPDHRRTLELAREWLGDA
jgi:tetratricopeptide (TPR) repeat protein